MEFDRKIQNDNKISRMHGNTMTKSYTIRCPVISIDSVLLPTLLESKRGYQWVSIMDLIMKENINVMYSKHTRQIET